MENNNEMNIVELFCEQRDLINYFFENLDLVEVEVFSNLILQYSKKGIIYLTGMGKSGIISRNISQMLVSIGIRAMFLSPVDALHGDVGVITPADLLILFSRSGQTAELVNLIPAARQKGAYLVAVVSNLDGIMVKQCDLAINLPLQKELCPFDLAPTTSSVIQLIFGNTIVATLMKMTGLTKEEYARNHPAGRIGKRLTIRISDVMKTRDELPICIPSDILINQIEYMSSKLCGCLLIEDKNKFVGIFTDGDLRRSIKKFGTGALTMKLGDLVNQHSWTCMKEQMAFEAMEEMERYDPQNGKTRIKEMPVVDGNGGIVGLITLHDLVIYGL